MSEGDSGGARRAAPAYSASPGALHPEMPYQAERAKMRESMGERRFSGGSDGSSDQSVAQHSVQHVLNMHQMAQHIAPPPNRGNLGRMAMSAYQMNQNRRIGLQESEEMVSLKRIEDRLSSDS